MSDCSAEEKLQSLEQAMEQILRLSPAISGVESIPVKHALNRVLQQEVVANINVPPFRNSSMDGYALPYPYDRSSSLTIIGTSWAGHPFEGAVAKNQCIRIFTGAQVPPSCQVVVMQENTTATEQQLIINTEPCVGENIRNIADDLRLGDSILEQGKLLKPADLGLIASCGVASVSVYRKLNIAFFSTGDELMPVGSPLKPGQIYDSNRYTLHSLIESIGANAIDLGVIPDQAAAVEEALLAAAKNNDVIITTGGVSVGEADYIVDVLKKIGQVDLWKIAIKPGKPLAFGHIGNCSFFGLPGNPVSTMVTFDQIVRPALKQMMGITHPALEITVQATSLADIKKQPGRKEFQRGIAKTIDNKLVVEPTGGQGSHILSSLSKANCYMILERESTGIKQGQSVNIQLIP